MEEDDSNFELTAEQKAVLDERLKEDTDSYLTSEESIAQLSKKYGI